MEGEVVVRRPLFLSVIDDIGPDSEGSRGR